MDKVELNVEEQRKLVLFTEEFKARGGMSTQEMITRFGAIPFDEFMEIMSEKIRNYKV